VPGKGLTLTPKETHPLPYAVNAAGLLPSRADLHFRLRSTDAIPQLNAGVPVFSNRVSGVAEPSIAALGNVSRFVTIKEPLRPSCAGRRDAGSAQPAREPVPGNAQREEMLVFALASLPVYGRISRHARTCGPSCRNGLRPNGSWVIGVESAAIELGDCVTD